MARNYAALPHEYLDELDELSDEEFGRLMRKLLEFSKDGTPITATGNERFYAKRVMAQEIRFQESYDVRVETNRENGKKGGRPKKTQKTHGFSQKPTESERNPKNLNLNQNHCSSGSSTHAHEDSEIDFGNIGSYLEQINISPKGIEELQAYRSQMGDDVVIRAMNIALSLSKNPSQALSETGVSCVNW